MYNFEKYSNEIADLNSGIRNFGVNSYTKKPTLCVNMDCTDCLFSYLGSFCEVERANWLLAEADPEPIDEEKDILEILYPDSLYAI